MSKYPAFTLRRKGTELKSSILSKQRQRKLGKKAMPHDRLSPLCLEHKDPGLFVWLLPSHSRTFPLVLTVKSRYTSYYKT